MTSGPTRHTATSSRDLDRFVPHSIRLLSTIGWRFLVLAACAWVLGKAVSATSVVVVPVALGLMLCALLEPAANWLIRRRLNRYLAAALITVGFLAIIIGLASMAGNSLATGFSALRRDLVAGLQRLEASFGTYSVSDAISSLWRWVNNNRGDVATKALAYGGSATELVAGAAIALITMFFFLADGDSIWRWFVGLLPPRTRQDTHEAFRRGWVTLGAYARTSVVVAFVDAVGVAIGALVLGLPLVAPIFVIVFFAAFVPIVGAISAGALAVLIALAVKGPFFGAIMLVIVIVVQQLEANILQPLLMGKAVDVHPWAVIVGVALGSILWGIIGAFLAVPVMAVANTVLLYLRGFDQFPEIGEDHREQPATYDTDPPPDSPLSAPDEDGPTGIAADTDI